MDKKAVLILEDGTVFHGKGFGAITSKIGELVFNTSMQGYQEALTDPSYAGQILTMTYPLIGNYGLEELHKESKKIQVEGFVVRELDKDSGLDSYLDKEGIPGIEGVDTRALVRKIRNFGVFPSSLVVYNDNRSMESSEFAKKIKFDYSNINFVEKVSVNKEEIIGEGNKKVVLIDLGVKNSIISELNKRGAQVIVVPFNTGAEKIHSYKPDGIIISNGPGDPAILTGVHKTIRELDNFPMFGICLGHQCIAHAFGGSTYKLKFGHRGSNHPVFDQNKNKVVITTQNHGFAVDKIPKDFESTHYELNDLSNEGMKHKDKPIFSVQFHPEASPGPEDSKYLFDEFVRLCQKPPNESGGMNI